MSREIECDNCYSEKSNQAYKKFKKENENKMLEIAELEKGKEYYKLEKYQSLRKETTFTRPKQYQSRVAEQLSFMYSMVKSKTGRCVDYTLCDYCAPKLYYAECPEENQFGGIVIPQREKEPPVIKQRESYTSNNDYQSQRSRDEGRSFSDDMSTISYIAGVTDWNGNYRSGDD